jgi:uncharacterized protein YndB with AHSA1/START domain
MSDFNRLEIIRNFKATPEQLFDAWTVPEQIVKWFGPQGVAVGEHSFDTRPGGNWKAQFLGESDKTIFATGTYKVLDRPHLLVTAWQWQIDGKPGDLTELTVKIKPTRAGAQLTLIHERFTSAQSRDDHHKGWSSTLDCLAMFTGNADHQ